MPIEIERKFLVNGEGWRAHVEQSKRFRQAYLARQGKTSIRVRVVDDTSAAITVKSQGARTSRLEFEYPIPVADALTLLEFRDGHLLSKVRHYVPYGGLTWEIDVFDGENAGLIIAEVELAHEQQKIAMPPWIGREITGDERYYNSHLAHRPFRSFAPEHLAEHNRAV
jgi:adenylate cyclase